MHVPPRMFHHVARSVPDRLLWFRDPDGIALFDGLARAFPELVALCLMPDHLHLVLPHEDLDNRLHRALAGYAHGLCVRRGLRGPLFAPRPPPQRIADRKHLRRTVRYIHLNPCRHHLVPDPLAWPFSTHRDRVGFAARPIVEVADNPAAFHRFVSADDTVTPAGTALPTAPYEPVAVARLAEAVAGVFRTPPEALFTRTPARRAFVRAAHHLGVARAEVQAHTGLSNDQLRNLTAKVPARGARLQDPVLVACVRAAADTRFRSLAFDDHRTERAWLRYAGRR